MARDPSDAQFRANLSGMLTDWATTLLQDHRAELAMTAWREAVELDATNGIALVNLGNLTFVSSHQLEEAIALWKRAQPHLTTAQWQAVAPRVAQAERDLSIERGFGGFSTDHFQIRAEGSTDNALVQQVAQLLERDYATLSSALGVQPNRMPVILYTSSSFQRAAGRRDWAFGLYDGRIRLRLDDVGSAMAPHLVAHELAHACLATAFGPHLPLWVHEGFAQAQEPAQPLDPTREAMRERLRSRADWVPLAWLDRRFTQPSNFDDLERAYLESRLAIESLIEAYGLGRVGTWLKRLSDGQALEAAFDETFAPLRFANFSRGHLPD